MLKKAKPKNKKAIFLLWTTSFFTLVCLAAYVLHPYVTINLILNTFPFLSFSAANKTPPFYGENIDMSQILPTSQRYVVNSKGQDLIDIAADLGINLIRIINTQRSFDNNADSIYTQQQWNQVLDKMQRKGIKAIILIETASNNGDYYAPDIRPVYLHLVQEYMNSGVFSNPDVYAVDIKNEPLLTNANLTMLQTAHRMIKAKYPDLKQTLGWWATPKSPKAQGLYNPDNYNWVDYSAGKKLDSLVDFYSIHMYGLDSDNRGLGVHPDLRTKLFVSQVENALQTTRPILIEEFGAANGDAVSDQNTIGNPQLQAKVYQGVYQALQEMHSKQIIGSVAFDFYTGIQYADAWAIVKNNGNYLFPAAYILQEYALGKFNPSLQAATVVSSQSYLLNNTDNHTLKNLHLSDRIGLTLQLDDSQNYSFSLSQNGILQPLESFHYNSVSDSYDGVYQAISKGNIQLTVLSTSICPTDNVCTYPVYTLTLTIQ